MDKVFYKTVGTCSQYIELTVDDNDIITRVNFIGGCNGNLQGICHLVTGMKMNVVKEKLNGISCSGKPTSCPDQLCRAIEQVEAMRRNKIVYSDSDNNH